MARVLNPGVDKNNSRHEPEEWDKARGWGWDHSSHGQRILSASEDESSKQWVHLERTVTLCQQMEKEQIHTLNHGACGGLGSWP